VGRRLGSAVRRNRIKRLVREYFRLHPGDAPGSCDIVVVPKRSLDARSLDLRQVAEDLAPALRRAAADHPPPAPEQGAAADTGKG